MNFCLFRGREWERCWGVCYTLVLGLLNATELESSKKGKEEEIDNVIEREIAEVSHSKGWICTQSTFKGKNLGHPPMQLSTSCC